MYNDFESRGIKRSVFAPPIYQLMWKLKIQIKPTYFASKISLFFTSAITFGIVFPIIGLIMNYVFDWYMDNNIFISIFASIFFGIFMTIFTKKRAKALILPKWEEYGE